MFCPLAFFLILLGFAGGFVCETHADTFELNDKSVVTGQPIAPNKQGVIIKAEDGTIPERVAWTNFTQSALKKFSQLPAAKPFVEPYLEPDEPESTKKARPEITVKPVQRLDQPDRKAGVGALFSSPLTLTLFLILYCANLYAAYEVSIFRNYPAAWVCILAAVLPVLGPIIFLSVPTRIPLTADEIAQQQLAEEELVAAGEISETGAAHAEHHAAPAAAAASTGPRHPPPTIYQRGQTTFNRRFFETKLSGFMRVVPGEAEKDMVIFIRSARGEHAGTRISRIMPNELSLQVTKGGASSEVTIPFTEIQELQIRHKEA